MSNLYRLFRDLLPATPLQIGTVTEAYGGVATVRLHGGALVQARGDAQVGQHVYIRNDLIEGIAPSLPVELIEV